MEILDSISQIVNVFSDTAESCVSTFFGKMCISEAPWTSDKQIDKDLKYVLIMGGASDVYQSILKVAMDSDVIFELTGQDLCERDFCDVFGEFANTYYAMLMDDRRFADRFGILNQTVPVLYTKGNPFLPHISCVQGHILVNGKRMFIGFAIRKNG